MYQNMVGCFFLMITDLHQRHKSNSFELKNQRLVSEQVLFVTVTHPGRAQVQQPPGESSSFTPGLQLAAVDGG
jgi:hypothetical protein